jgi:hypothetical protein
MLSEFDFRGEVAVKRSRFHVPVSAVRLGVRRDQLVPLRLIRPTTSPGTAGVCEDWFGRQIHLDASGCKRLAQFLEQPADHLRRRDGLGFCATVGDAFLRERLDPRLDPIEFVRLAHWRCPRIRVRN